MRQPSVVVCRSATTTTSSTVSTIRVCLISFRICVQISVVRLDFVAGLAILVKSTVKISLVIVTGSRNTFSFIIIFCLCHQINQKIYSKSKSILGIHNAVQRHRFANRVVSCRAVRLHRVAQVVLIKHNVHRSVRYRWACQRSAFVSSIRRRRFARRCRAHR